MKAILLIGGYLAIGVALADLATGKSSTPILGSTVTNMLTQEIDVALLLIGAGTVWYSHKNL